MLQAHMNQLIHRPREPLSPPTGVTGRIVADLVLIRRWHSPCSRPVDAILAIGNDQHESCDYH
jgi:hypothetical protein